MKISLTVGFGLLVTAVVICLFIVQKTAAIEREADSLLVSESEQQTLRSEIDQLRARIAELERRGPNVENKAAPSEETSQSSTIKENNIFGTWLQRVERLSDYLDNNRALEIPEMKNLTPSDWLDVTKFRTIETDADYRVALAKLRQIAKQRQGESIKRAFMKFLEDSDGKLPDDASQLLAYANGDFDSSVIARYRINPSGKLPENKYASEMYLVETDQFVDPLWNSRIYFRDDGVYGWSGPPDLKQKHLLDSLHKFQTKHGRPPANSQELEPFVREKYRSDLPELLESTTSAVEFH